MSTSNVPRFLAIAAKDRARRIGIPYTQALAEIQDELRNGQGGKHDHLGYGVGREVLAIDPFGQDVDLDAALALIAAVRAGCPACQDRHYDTVASSNPLIAAVTAPIIKVTPEIMLAHFGPSIRELVPTFKRAYTEGDAQPAYTALDEFEHEKRLDVLEEALDTWAAGAAEPDTIQFHTIELDDDREPAYAVVLQSVKLVGDGGTITRPALALVPEAGAAGLEHLREVGLPLLEPGGMPEMDPNWRLRVSISGQKLVEIVHTDWEGDDDVELWRAAQDVRVSDTWWNLLDRSSHVLIIGPCAEDGTWAATEPVAAVVANVSFWS